VLADYPDLAPATIPEPQPNGPAPEATAPGRKAAPRTRRNPAEPKKVSKAALVRSIHAEAGEHYPSIVEAANARIRAEEKDSTRITDSGEFTVSPDSLEDLGKRGKFRAAGRGVEVGFGGSSRKRPAATAADRVLGPERPSEKPSKAHRSVPIL